MAKPKNRHLRASVCKRFRRGQASRFIRYWKDELQPGDKVILLPRVTTESQWERLTEQDFDLRACVRERGAKVIRIFEHIGSATGAGWEGVLARAAKLARKEGAKLFAVGPSRFARTSHFDSKWNRDAQAREADWEDFAWITDGVIAMTLLHPDVTAMQELAAYRESVRRHRPDSVGGRPTKQRRGCYRRRATADDLAEVIRLKKLGLSGREVARRMNRSPQTVAGWIEDTRESWMLPLYEFG
jgi:hypothetical protein